MKSKNNNTNQTQPIGKKLPAGGDKECIITSGSY